MENKCETIAPALNVHLTGIAGCNGVALMIVAVPLDVWRKSLTGGVGHGAQTQISGGTPSVSQESDGWCVRITVQSPDIGVAVRKDG
jgi:hypothetical protein